jgi:hypothetical protein
MKNQTSGDRAIASIVTTPFDPAHVAMGSKHVSQQKRFAHLRVSFGQASACSAGIMVRPFGTFPSADVLIHSVMITQNFDSGLQ